MKAGADKTDITPPLGLPMGGGVADPRRGSGVDIPLYCRSIVLQDGSGRYSTVTACDLLLLERIYVDKAFKAASARTGIPTESMMLSCSHTHSGPQTSKVFTAPIPPDVADYLDGLVNRIATSIATAHGNLTDTRMGFSVGLEDKGIGQNSRYLLKDGTISWFDFTPDEIVEATGPVDPEVAVLRFVDGRGGTIGLIYNYACHACTVMLDRYSADYPGVASAAAEDALGGAALFLPGACGNIHPISEWLSPEGVFAYPPGEDKRNAVRRNGQLLAEKVLEIAQAIRQYCDGNVRSVKREIRLPVRDVSGTTVSHIEEQLRIRKCSEKTIREHLDVFRRELDELRRGGRTLDTVLQAMRIGDCAVVGVPAEMFVEFGLEMKRQSPFPHTMVAELTNDWVGYTPTLNAFKRGGYQTWAAKSSRLAPEAGDTIVRAVSAMLSALWSGQGG